MAKYVSFVKDDILVTVTDSSLSETFYLMYLAGLSSIEHAVNEMSVVEQTRIHQVTKKGY